MIKEQHDLIAESESSLRSNGNGGKTRASEVKTFLQNVIDTIFGKFYNKAETDTLLAGKAAINHIHEDLASKVYTDAAVASIVDSAPATLNTLNELAQALGDDPNFAATLSNQVGLKVDKTSVVRPGVTRLFRRDDDSNFSLQTHWEGGKWHLQGYQGDTYHAGVFVSNAESSNTAARAEGANKLWSTTHPIDFYLTNSWNGTEWVINTNHNQDGIPFPVRVQRSDLANKANSLDSGRVFTNSAGIIYRNDAGQNKSSIEYNNPNNRLEFYTNNGSWQNTMTLTADNGGSIGIGTDTPQSKLHVVGEVRASTYFTLTGAGSLGIISGTDVKLGANGKLVLGAGSQNDRLTILPNGNIGLGLSDPNGTLSVARGTGVDGTAVFKGTTNFSHFNHSTSEDTYIRGGKSGSKVILNDGIGNVAIGSTIATSRLHIKQSSNNWDGGILLERIDTASNWRIVTGGDDQFYLGFSISNTGDGSINGVGISPAITIKPNGNVGMGTVSAEFKLHLMDGDNSMALYGPNNLWNGRLLVGSGTNKALSQTAQVISTNGNLHLDAAPNQATYINFYSGTDTYINVTGGNVGVGNTAPGCKLDVAGAIRATDNIFASGTVHIGKINNAATLSFPAVNGFGNDPAYIQHIETPSNTAEMRFVVSDDATSNDRFTFGSIPGGVWAERASISADGNITAAGDITAYSDARLKENIKPITSALAKVKALEGVSYNRKDINGKLEIGLIAQAVKEVIPEIVKYEQSNDLHSLDYGKLSAVLIEAIKEISGKLEKLEEEFRH